MTYREAIECLRCTFYNMECCQKEECNEYEAIAKAIEALETVEKYRDVITYCGTCSNRHKCIKSDL